MQRASQMTQTLFTEHHFFSTVENDINSLCQPMFNKLGITFFGYVRCHDDGRATILCNSRKLLQYFFRYKAQIITAPEQQIICKKFHYLIFPTNPSCVKALENIKTHLKLANFFNMSERHFGYIDVFAFGTSPDNRKIINIYLNNIDFLDKFKLFFKDKAKSLLNQAYKNQIVLPEIMRPTFKGLTEPDINNDIVAKINFLEENPLPQYRLTGKYQHINFSQQQYQCLKKLILGCTTKEIAQSLGKSPRTIEHHLENIKTKLGCYRKSEIIKIFLEYSKSDY